MRQSALIAALALACVATNCHAQCGLFGRLFRPRAMAGCQGGGQTAYGTACYSTRASYSAACYSTVLQAPTYYAVPTPQSTPQAPSKATPQAPAKVSPQAPEPPPVGHKRHHGAANDSAPLPPSADEAPIAPSALETPLPPPAEPAPVVVEVQTDPYGFQNHLNAYRAQYGLRPLRFSQRLAYWAHQNSLRGFGHTVMVSRRQNAAWGQANAAAVARDWLASPGHRAAMLDPTVTEYGIAVAGNVWTANFD